MVQGSGHASNKNGDYMTLLKWACYKSIKRVGYIQLRNKFGLKGMRHIGKILTRMRPQSNNKKLPGFFYSNLIISSFGFRPFDISNTSAND